MKSPNLKKEVTRLNGILTALNIFMSKSAQHALPFYQLLKKKIDFEWTNDCEEAFKCLKKTLATPLVLTRPSSWEGLYLYLVVSNEVVRVVLIREPGAHHRPVYFISKALAWHKRDITRLKRQPWH